MAQVTLGIVDVSPASIDRALPSIVAQTVQCAPELEMSHPRQPSSGRGFAAPVATPHRAPGLHAQMHQRPGVDEFVCLAAM